MKPELLCLPDGRLQHGSLVVWGCLEAQGGAVLPLQGDMEAGCLQEVLFVLCSCSERGRAVLCISWGSGCSGSLGMVWFGAGAYVRSFSSRFPDFY